ncbi:MAG: nuclear pore complex subunit [Flavobacteriales bacterium CG_4_10_14_0_2_um_filter_32_8]|nr:MAG: nuclear pore complex subunit [Flavobacteriales bacterium CG_4_10_14_0_2_um_filter_32_8]PJB13862.1 MAG: nuclear pore complex subunit [Flavobacteriales bacterium CG_4_9_14_3_um_filter_32_8]
MLLIFYQLKVLKIDTTQKTPDVDFNHTSGVLQISGISVPENSLEFYDIIIKWLEEYIQNPVETTKIIFKLTYVNTSSLQFLYDILILLDGIHNKTSNIQVDWYYLSEDLDMKEMGEDYQEALSVDFSFFEVEVV